jgi:hypothetical protein
MLPNRLNLCACALLPLTLVVILARTIVFVPMHALARIVPLEISCARNRIINLVMKDFYINVGQQSKVSIK